MMDSHPRSRDATEQALLQIAIPDGLYILPRDLGDQKLLELGSFGEQQTLQLVLAVALLIVSMLLFLV